MTNTEIARAHSMASPQFQLVHQVRRLCCLATLLLIALITAMSGAQSRPTAKQVDPVPEAGISAIIAAFDKYEVVGLPQGHGMQDLNDFIFTLIRTPAFRRR